MDKFINLRNKRDVIYLKRILSTLLSVIIAVTLVLPINTVTAEGTVAKVKFDVTENADGIVEMDVTVADTEIQVFQTALRYNTDVLVPVSSDNEPAKTFDDFIVRNETTEVFKEIGMNLDTDKGVFGFTFYVFPGTRDENVIDDVYVTDSNGVNLCKFRFKRIAEGDYGFEVAFKDESKPYQESLPEGMILTDGGASEDTEVIFNINGSEIKEVITPEPPVMDVYVPKTSAERKSDVICLMVDRNMTFTYGMKQAIDEEDSLVVPYIKEDRTLVPLRYIAEALGAQVLWEPGWDGCIIEKDEKKIEITFGSAEFTVNGEVVTYDAPIEVVRDRTMIPVRFVSEELGCDVYWNQLNRAVVISPAENPWVEDREVEITALNEMMLTIVGLL